MTLQARWHDRGDLRVIELVAGTLDSEAAALEALQLCAEAQTDRVLIPGERLTAAFFDLRTGTAGDILRKFSTYRVAAAAVVSADQIGRGKFYEFTLETNRGRSFRVFDSKEAALEWLFGL